LDVRVNSAIDGADIDARASDGGEGVTRVEFVPPITGEYYISAGIVDADGNGAEIAGSPFTVNINKATPDEDHASKTFANETVVDFTGFERPKYDGTTSFLIRKTGHTLPIRYHYDVKVICVPTGKEIIGAKALDQKNGTYKVTIVPPQGGDYYVEVDLIDKADRRYTVKGSPFTVNINPAARSPVPSPSPRQVQGVWGGPAAAKSQSPITTHRPTVAGVISQQPYARRSQPSSPSAALVKGTPPIGTGKAWSRPSVDPPKAKMSVPPWVQKSGKVWKPQNPPVEAPTFSMSKVTAKFGGSSGAKLVQSKSNAKITLTNTPSKYTVTAHELGLGEGEGFDVSLESPCGNILPVDITYTDGLFDISYTATEVGDHKIVFIRGGNVAIEDIIAVDEEADDGQSLAVGYTITIEARLRSGQPKWRGGDKFEVVITGPRGQVDGVQVTDNGNGKYTVSYSLPGPGEYTINATVNGRHIARSPWKQVV